MEFPNGYAPRIYFFHSLLVGPLDAWPAQFAHAAGLGFDHALIGGVFAPGQAGHRQPAAGLPDQQWYSAGQASPQRPGPPLPANQAAWNLPALKDDPNVKIFGQQLENAKSPPPFHNGTVS